jgi:hypothetical protein
METLSTQINTMKKVSYTYYLNVLDFFNLIEKNLTKN